MVMDASDRDQKTVVPGAAPTKPAVAAAAEPIPAAGAPTEPIPAALANNPDYEVLRELNRGGMGVVYLARNRRMDRLECLKVVNEGLLKQAGALERFEREMRSAGKVNHPNIVTAFAALSLEGLIAFAMEYVDGTDLSKLVQAHGRLPVSNACYYINQAAKALQYAHEKGMVHRDIKPGNLMLTRDGKRQVVKVLDFGLAKATSENQLDGGLTGTGQMLGTPQYIAPEQIENAATAGIQADIYSLGCTLYYLLSGSPPFDGKTSLYAVLHAHQVEPARPLNEIRPDVPAEVVAIVNKMMAKSAAERYQEPGEVAHALAPYFKSGIRPIPASGVPFSQSAPSAIDSNVAPSPAHEMKTETKTDNLRSRDTFVPPAKSASQSASPQASAPTGPVPSPATSNPVPASPAVANPLQTIVETVRESDGRSGAARSSPQVSVRPARKPLSTIVWVATAAGVIIVGFVASWAAGVFQSRPTDAILTIKVNEPDADIFIDGEKAKAAWDDGRTHASVHVQPGERHVEVRKDGFFVFERKLTFKAGDQEEFSASLKAINTPVNIPPVYSGPKPNKQSKVAQTPRPAPVVPAKSGKRGPPPGPVAQKLPSPKSDTKAPTNPVPIGVQPRNDPQSKGQAPENKNPAAPAQAAANAERDEKAADAKFRAAESLLKAGNAAGYRRMLKELVEKYPETKAAEKARRALK